MCDIPPNKPYLVCPIHSVLVIEADMISHLPAAEVVGSGNPKLVVGNRRRIPFVYCIGCYRKFTNAPMSRVYNIPIEYAPDDSSSSDYD